MGGSTFFQALALGLVATTLQAAQAMQDGPQRQEPRNGTKVDDVDRLRAMLAQPGPDAREDRERAVEGLLTLPDERAHAVLQTRLGNADDPDDIRLLVLQALTKRLLNGADPLFAVRNDNQELSTRILRGYAGALAKLWGDVDEEGNLPPGKLGEAARACLVRMPARELELGLRDVAADTRAPMPRRIAALRAAADTQRLHFVRLLAEFLEASEAPLVQAARQALRRLTFVETPFETREQAETFLAQCGTRTYADVAEEAARSASRLTRQHREEMARLRREAAAEFVRVATERRSGVDWPAVQARTLGDDPLATAACLGELRRTLETLPGDDASPHRITFARALMQGFKDLPPRDVAQRALYLEVTAYLCRQAEVELAKEVSDLLTQQLLGQPSAAAAPLQLAALRGLRRHPSAEARAVVVRFASDALAQGEPADGLLAQALQTLGDRTEPTWRAPADTHADRAAWLQLLRLVCLGSASKDRRRDALAVLQLQDRDGKRVTEGFDLLLEIVRDPRKDADFRVLCLIALQNWLDDETRANTWTRELALLLADEDPLIRRHAAVSLTKLPNASEKLRGDWTRLLVAALRERLRTEQSEAVLQAVTECLAMCARGPGSPEAVIGALIHALDTIGVPVPQGEQSRVAALLATLMRVAAEANADPGQWVRACDTLLKHERRAEARHVLESHSAVASLVRDVRNSDPTRADVARRALWCVLQAALLKPPKESWLSTPKLKAEADDVLQSFEALAGAPPVPGVPGLEEPQFRLLRLDALLAAGRTKDVLTFGTAYLAETDPKEHRLLDAAQKDEIRLMMAEAMLRENKIDDAARTWEQVDPARRADPRALDLAEGIAKAYVPRDPVKAVAWFGQLVRATAEDAPVYRSRYLALLQARLKANPADRAQIVEDLERKWTLFEAPDCPEELKAQALALRNAGTGG